MLVSVTILVSAILPLAGAWPHPSYTTSTSPLSTSLISDTNLISKYWGQLTPYADNAADYFSVQDVGIPDGCQLEQAHTLQRHSNRFPTSFYDDGLNDENFGKKIMNWTSANAEKFTGPLSFLNSWHYIMGSSLLTGLGASSEFQSGVQFWNRYGRTLYNASAGQLAYNASFENGTARPKPVLRTTSQSRIENSQINWSLGFFGTSFETVPNPKLENFTAPFDLVIIPEGGTENNTLASYDSCFNDDNDPTGQLGDLDLEGYIPMYLKTATARMQQFAPSGFSFTANDTYAMQSLCAYEMAYISSSSFCSLFTLSEWEGFENTLDMEYYYDYSFGSPTGRAQGIGYLQELLARLQNEYITTSNSSVNSTITNNAAEFPLGRPFYADFSHDDIIVSVMTAMSLDYFKDPPSLTQYPPDPNRKFILSRITPFTARLITEVIGCSDAEPGTQSEARTQYSPGQYGYSASNATHKFIRMRLNNGILPLSTIRGGGCAGRTDGLCAMDGFLKSQESAYALSEYNYACFGNYTILAPTSGQDYDGAIVPPS
ncbi:3-phytase [Lophium mytilinum]|uniref:3-phytase n=1 Tax=Lophium mytilinum TaxID=390894 RepID=A0A6A6QEG8_9PEZI|nr:3-phytase [Lophium mytilinum]